MNIPSSIKTDIQKMWRSGMNSRQIAERLPHIDIGVIQAVCKPNTKNVGLITSVMNRTGRFIPLEELNRLKGIKPKLGRPKKEPVPKVEKLQIVKEVKIEEPKVKEVRTVKEVSEKWREAGFLAHKTRRINIIRKQQGLPPVTLALKPNKGYETITAEEIAAYKIPEPNRLTYTLHKADVIRKAAPVVSLHPREKVNVREHLDDVIDQLEAIKKAIPEEEKVGIPKSKGF